MNALTAEQIREIADQMDMGFRCFVHRETGELVVIPDEQKNPIFDTEFWEEDMERVADDRAAFWEPEPMTSTDSFEIMEDFAGQLSDRNPLKHRLLKALSERKPFRHFKFVIDDSGDYRDEWFAYKRARLQEWVTAEFEKELVRESYENDSLPDEE